MPPAENAAPRTRKPAKAPTAVEAIGKVGKILEQLSPADKARVLAFLTAPAGE